MADVIFDLPDLSNLYPNIPKEAFGQFRSSSSGTGAPTANGYVRHTLVTQVEGFKGGYDSKPATPMMPGGFQYEPVAWDPMDMEIPHPDINVNDGIDVLSILGLTGGDSDSAFMQQNPPGNS